MTKLAGPAPRRSGGPLVNPGAAGPDAIGRRLRALVADRRAGPTERREARRLIAELVRRLRAEERRRLSLRTKVARATRDDYRRDEQRRRGSSL